MKVTLIAHTPNPEAVVAAAAKVCYSSLYLDEIVAKTLADDNDQYLDMLSDLGHQSPIEHASFTFAIEGVSRSLLAQLTRHRIASYSVRSQRYVSEKNFGYVTPPTISDDDDTSAVYEEAMSDSLYAYHKLVDRLTDLHVKHGMDKSAARKKAQEDARFVLPNACETQLVVTMNARSLYNFFRLRCCNRAQWEIRELANEMLRLCQSVAPHLFANAGPACKTGPCSEGKMSCRRSAADA